MNPSGTKSVFWDRSVIGVHITRNFSSQGSSSLNQDTWRFLQSVWKSKNEQIYFIMYNEEICSYSVSNLQKELWGKCSVLTLLALGWHFCLSKSLQHESFGIQLLINLESPTAVSNYDTSISIHVQTDLFCKLQSSC